MKTPAPGNTQEQTPPATSLNTVRESIPDKATKAIPEDIQIRAATPAPEFNNLIQNVKPVYIIVDVNPPI